VDLLGTRLPERTEHAALRFVYLLTPLFLLCAASRLVAHFTCLLDDIPRDTNSMARLHEVPKQMLTRLSSLSNCSYDVFLGHASLPVDAWLQILRYGNTSSHVKFTSSNTRTCNALLQAHTLLLAHSDEIRVL
jgi:hypothetical protein